MNDEVNVSNLQALQLDPGLTDAASAPNTTEAGDTFQPGLLGDVIAHQAQLPAERIPVLQSAPTESGEVLRSADGSAFFVPVATLPTRSKRSKTPAVFLEADDTGQWSLLVWIDLVRPAGAPKDAQPLPVSDITALLTATASESTATFSVTDLPPPDAGVMRRLALAVPVDAAVMADALRTDMNAAVVVSGTVYYRDQSTVALTPEEEEALQAEEQARREEVERFRASGGSDEQAYRMAQLQSEQAHASMSELLDVGSASMLLGPGGGGVPAYLPTSDKPNRPIYYHWNFKSGADTQEGMDPDNVWVDSGAGLWQVSPLPNQYFVLPHEYRLAFDVERGTPAMSVLLVRETGAGAEGPAETWKVRVRFKLVPWLEPQELEKLRATITELEGVSYPQLVMGGYSGATFDESSWLRDLGGKALSSEGGATQVDARGFELVLDCSMEFYTLLARLLAPATGAATGVEGRVMLDLRTSSDEQAALAHREVPVKIRLDRPDDGFLTTEQITAPFPDPATWPTGWTPPFYAKVRSPCAVQADVSGVIAALLVVDPLTGVPVDHARAAVAPTAFSVGLPSAPPVQPPPESAPAAAAGAPVFKPPANPQVGNGEVLVRLTQTESTPVDPRVVSSLALDFTGVTVRLDAAVMLERVHELGTSTGLVARVNVSSYQLKHPESLPPELADVFGIDVEVKRGTSEAVTVSLNRDTSEASLDIPFGFSDLVADLHPDQPKFEYRRRNVATKGTGEFSPWESVVGKNLHITPVT
ncbi:hypothetical protein [Streptomyces sp. NPDC060022]|uniref:hypothetical protein n=1 Tax=Streptomyces sp. NPDC060022 TaxID=3347039 RepID=UPI0036A982DD